MFFIGAAMLLTTAGVFAGKAKFAESLDVYVNVHGVSTYTEITNGSQSFTGLTATPGGSNTQATIKDRNNNTYDLTYKSGLSYFPVYSTSAF